MNRNANTDLENLSQQAQHAKNSLSNRVEEGWDQASDQFTHLREAAMDRIASGADVVLKANRRALQAATTFVTQRPLLTVAVLGLAAYAIFKMIKDE